MKPGVLGNLAAGLAGSFVSRNNDCGGYWALGQLKLLASRLGVGEFRIRIRPLADQPRPLLAEIARRHAALLTRMIERVRCDAAAIAEGEIVVRLAAEWHRGAPDPATWGDPIACDVRLTDSRGRQATATRVTTCGPHDPSREQRSARPGDAYTDAAENERRSLLAVNAPARATATTTAARRRPILAIVAFNVAVLLSLISLAGSHTTYAREIERKGLVISLVCGIAALGAIAASWSRMPRGVKMLAVATMFIASIGAFEAASRLA